jgi:DNA-directed RNA polymerase specialized sigma24 family protein
MFRQYRSSDQWATPNASSPVDQRDAAKIQKAWQQLPARHRAAIGWHYVTPGSPTKACKAIGCTMDGLAQYVIDGRQILINRRA